MTAERENVLVIKLSGLGEFVLALPSMAAIRAAHPQAHITLLTTRPFVDIAQRSRYFNDIMVDECPRWFDLVGGLLLAQKIKKKDFARVYDLQLDTRTALYRMLMLRNTPWSGAQAGGALSYNDPQWRLMHPYDRHKAILKLAGIDVAMADLSWMNTDVSLYNVRKPYVLLVPGSAATHPEKRWPALKFAALAMKLMRRGYSVVLLGTNAENAVMERINRAAPGCTDLSSRTSFYDIATLAQGAAGAVGNDTGPLHLIAMTGCPVVALFSAYSDPAQSAPVGNNVIIQADDMSDILPEDVIKQLKCREVT